ncbi:MAG: hypothetical protein AAFS10_12930 [Myxococcota bacterium]
MDLKKSVGARKHLMAVALIGLLCWVVSCGGGPKIKAPGGIPTRTDTACTFAAEATEHGTSDTPFTCRGALADISGNLIGLVQTAKQQSYTLVALQPDGSKTAEQSTPHTTKPYLVEVKDGFLLLSATGDKVMVTRHTAALGPVEEDNTSRLSMAGGEIVDFDVVQWPAEGVAQKVLMGVSTVRTIRAWQLDVQGEQMAEPTALDILSFPEMPDCNDLKLTAKAADAWFARLRCEYIMPAEPTIAEGKASIPSFDEESEDVPEFADVLLDMDGTLQVNTARAVAVDELSTVPDPRYTLKNYLKEELPRQEGFRVRILDAIAIGSDQAITLACLGPDDAPATFISATLTCDTRP